MTDSFTHIAILAGRIIAKAQCGCPHSLGGDNSNEKAGEAVKPRQQVAARQDRSAAGRWSGKQKSSHRQDASPARERGV